MGVGCGGAEVSLTRKLTPGFNFRRGLRVGTWNIQTLSDDSRLPPLSAELRRLRTDIVALSEVRRPGSGETSCDGYTYYWSGCNDGTHQRGVAVAVSSVLRSAVAEVTPVDERIMLVRMKHSLGFISLIAVYAPTE